MAHGNSAVNPVLYGLTNENFRNGYRTVLGLRGASANEVARRHTLSAANSRSNRRAAGEQSSAAGKSFAVDVRRKCTAVNHLPAIEEAWLKSLLLELYPFPFPPAIIRFAFLQWKPLTLTLQGSHCTQLSHERLIIVGCGRIPQFRVGPIHTKYRLRHERQQQTVSFSLPEIRMQLTHQQLLYIRQAKQSSGPSSLRLFKNALFSSRQRSITVVTTIMMHA